MSNYRTGRVVVLALLLFGAGLAFIARVGRPRISLRTQSPVRKPTLLVLPFENLSGDPDLEVVAAEVPRAVLQALADNERFQSVVEENGLGYVAIEGLEAAARKLGADYVIAGSVERSGARLAVDAYFFRAGPEPGLWVERLEWDPDEKSAVAVDLGRRIGEAFRVRY
jgi:adenylate cyclase